MYAFLSHACTHLHLTKTAIKREITSHMHTHIRVKDETTSAGGARRDWELTRPSKEEGPVAPPRVYCRARETAQEPIRNALNETLPTMTGLKHASSSATLSTQHFADLTSSGLHGAFPERVAGGRRGIRCG